MGENESSEYEPQLDPVPIDPVVPLFREWALLKARTTQLSAERDKLRDRIAKAVEERGYTDHKGSQLLDLPFPLQVGDTTYTRIKRERRVSVVPDVDAAEAICHNVGIENGVGDEYYERAFPLVRQLDVEMLYVLLQEGVLDEEDMDTIFVEHETYAFRGLTS
jgi:hypothetical protein